MTTKPDTPVEEINQRPRSALDLLTEMELIVVMETDPDKRRDRIMNYCVDNIPRTTPSVVRSVLREIMDYQSSGKTVEEIIDIKTQTWLMLSEEIARLSKMGYQGITIIDDDISPVKINRDTTAPIDRKEEDTMVRKVMDFIMEEHDLEKVEGHVLLFGEAGYSGDMHYVLRVREKAKQQSSFASLFGGGVQPKAAARRVGKKR